MFPPQIIHWQLDLLALILMAIGAVWYCSRLIHHRHPGEKLPLDARYLVAAVVVVTGIMVEWSDHQRREGLIAMVSGYGPTFALELKNRGHAAVTPATHPDDPTYLGLIEAQKEWLAINPSIADIYTFRADPADTITLIVDSETDYDHNGVFEGEREERTGIGEIYGEATPLFWTALDGMAVFDPEIVTDRWGTWVSSYTPIRDEEGCVEAAVGIDFAASEWIGAIAVDRELRLFIGGVLLIVILRRATTSTLVKAEARDRALVEENLRRANEASEIASRTKSEITAMMSHEIRTPLNAINGFANLLTETKLDATQKRYVETVIGAGDRLLILLDQVLDLSQNSEARIAIQKTVFSPVLLIHEVLDIVSDSAAKKGLTLAFEPRVADSLNLEGDPVRLRQILLNIVGNAIKFTERGKVNVCAEWNAAHGGSREGRLDISVQDTGVGIPADKLPTIFQSRTLTDLLKLQGTVGLGLALCKRLIDAMGGTIEASNAPGNGSRFAFSVACANVRETAQKEAGQVVAEQKSQEKDDGGRILIVEDNPLNAKLLEAVLRRFGFDADLADDGIEALELLEHNTYAAIVTDLDMPRMDGFALTRRIRDTETPDQRTPIIALTANTSQGTQELCFAAGMDEYLTKPVYPPALKSTLAALTSSPVCAATG